jgi:hypothetical protein
VSQYFDVGDVTLWNPSHGVALLFASTVETMVPLADQPSGVTDLHTDEYRIDPALFAAFVDTLVRRYLGSSHPVLRTLMEGFLATALVLVERAGGTVTALDEATELDPRDVPDNAARLRQLADELAPAMPR